MAKIEFKGFVQAHENPKAPWTVVEGHSVKDGDKWVTKSRTFHKVWLPDTLTGLPVDDLVTVTGTQKTTVSEYQGEKKYNLVVYADTVTNKAGEPVGAAVEEPWAATNVNTETPF